MIELSLGEIAGIVGGRLHDGDPATLVTGSVEFDSRRIGAGGLFVMLPGERVDGHDFAATAMRAGAVATLGARPAGDGVPTIVVPPVAAGQSRALALAGDTDGAGAAVLAGLAALARAVLDRLPGLTVVGITGSSGKTSTKDLVAALLAGDGENETVAPPGSFNNELGHPWTVLRCDARTRTLICEMSARGPGHIAGLCAVSPPRIGALLNIGSAHLGEFGSREAIAAAKGELIEALPADGLAVLNADDELVLATARRTGARVCRVGQAGDADVRAEDVTLDHAARASFTLRTPHGSVPVTLGLHGAHHVGNALAAAAVALEVAVAAGEEPRAALLRIAGLLGAARPVSASRMDVRTRADGMTLINDSYNANPESVTAALHALATISAARPDGAARRSWAVLGPMGELGEASAAAHEEIGGLLAELGIDRLIAVGQDAAGLRDGASRNGMREEGSIVVLDVDAALDVLRAELGAEDVVLLKASNFVQLWRVADGLLDDGNSEGLARAAVGGGR